MAILSFELGQLFVLLLPELDVELVVDVSFPSEPDFFQKFLSIRSKLSKLVNPIMIFSLRIDPLP
jgi:hypothetical protein